MTKRFKNMGLNKGLVLPFLALITFLSTRLLYAHPHWVETHYSGKVYPAIARTLSSFSNLFPFSLDDLFYFLLIFTLVLLVSLLLIRKITFKKAGTIVLNTLAAGYILFYLLWGFNYFRSDLNTRLELAEQEPDTEAFLMQLEELIENTNESYITIDEINKAETDRLVEAAYQKCAPALKIGYPFGTRKDKGITLSGFFAKAGISGYYGPFFNEVHVNKKVLPVEYPFTLAHEKAHQMGITSEAEANFYAWLACSQSDSQLLRYAANLQILRYFLFQAYQLEEYPDLVAGIDDRVKADINRIRENWLKMRNEKVDRVASKMNDAYLKTNRVEKGIEDYHGVVKFVMDFSQDTLFQQSHNLKVD